MKIRVEIAVGDLAAINIWLAQQVPVIAFVNAGDLAHWRTEDAAAEIIIQHAVIVVGTTAQTIFLLDPALDEGPIVVPEVEFMLAWIWMDSHYAILQVVE